MENELLLRQLDRAAVAEGRLLEETLAKIEHDFDFLLGCLAEVLESLGEKRLAGVLPALRDGAPPSHAEAASDEDIHREIQVYSIAFQLLNLVEENAAAQARRAREAAGEFTHEPGLWGQNLRQLKEAGLSAAEIADVLPEIRVEPVLTAHPTEAKRPTVLRQHRALYVLLVKMENQMWTPLERQEIRGEVCVALERLWRTGEFFTRKPEVAHELDNVMYYLRRVFPGVLGRVDRRLRQAWAEAEFDPGWLSDPGRLPRLRFGTWVGGDRDGHPFVTGEVTRQTLEKLRAASLELLGEELDELRERLSLSRLLHAAPADLIDAVERLGRTQPEAHAVLAERYPMEPWRHYVGLLAARLPPGGTPDPARHYVRPGELARDLAFLRKTLVDVGARSVAESDVVPVERLLQTFGFHLASLDIRQNSDFHDRAMEQLLAAARRPNADFGSWDEVRRIEFLDRELESPRPFLPRRARPGSEAEAVLDCYRVLADHVEARGRRGINGLVVSMTRRVSDLLVVYLFAREVGLGVDTPGGLAFPLPVIPLFERVEDLEKGDEVLASFLDHPVTRRSLALQRRTRPVQEVMVGYSDSNKDGGIFSSQWCVHTAQQRMARAAEERGVLLRVFHGRGGTSSRGAGPTHRFLDALPHGALHGDLRMTEQGETIEKKFANQITSAYNIELLLAGVAATTIRHRQSRDEPTMFRQACGRLADYSREAYRSLLREPGFMEYWSQATPIDALEMASIGSRPSRRTGRRTLEDLRAIPWVFSWNQSRFYLTGWFGVGSGLARLRDEAPELFAFLGGEGRGEPFLRYVLNNAETSLASASPEIMRQYSALVEDAAVRAHFDEIILAELDRTGAMIDEVFHAPRGVRRPRMTSTIRLRDAGLRRLHLHQVRLLARWRRMVADGRDDAAEALAPALLQSINAIASGQRTTG